MVVKNSDHIFYHKKIRSLIDIQNFLRTKIVCIIKQNYLKIWNMNVDINSGNKFRQVNIFKKLRINYKLK